MVTGLQCPKGLFFAVLLYPAVRVQVWGVRSQAKMPLESPVPCALSRNALKAAPALGLRKSFTQGAGRAFVPVVPVVLILFYIYIYLYLGMARVSGLLFLCSVFTPLKTMNGKIFARHDHASV